MNQINKAVGVLKKSGIIAYPTDTIYGLGANIFDQKAVKRVFKLKGRSFDKPLSIAVADFKMIEELAHVSDENRGLIKKLLPGPITILLLKKDIVPDYITRGSKLVGIRFPKNREAIEIIKKVGFPITSTSANPSGKPDVFKAEDIKLNVDFIIRGECKYKKSSTIVDLENKKILRRGTGINLLTRLF